MILYKTSTPNSGDSTYAWRVNSDGSVRKAGIAYYEYGVAPVLYLSSELEIESGSGDGSSSNPYKLSA